MLITNHVCASHPDFYSIFYFHDVWLMMQMQPARAHHRERWHHRPLHCHWGRWHHRPPHHCLRRSDHYYCCHQYDPVHHLYYLFEYISTTKSTFLIIQSIRYLTIILISSDATKWRSTTCFWNPWMEKINKNDSLAIII